MKKLLFLLLLCLLSGLAFGQQIKYSAPVPHTAGAPTSTPTFYNSWLRFDKTNNVLYSWNGETWTNVAKLLASESSGNYIEGNLGIEEPDPTEALDINGNIRLGTAGNKLKIAVGTNASVGTSTLVGGTVTVSTTAVATASKIFVSRNTTGGTVGHLNCPTASIVNGTSFVINSSSGTDTSTVNWWIIN